MARMIPPTVHPSVQSNAERRLFDVFRDTPGTEEWVCLHSLALAQHETKRRAEIDFLLLTRQGIFVLEVKGGRISRKNGIWVFTDRWGNSNSKSESPFDQASTAMFSLERQVRTEFEDNKRRRRLLFGFGAMFPDIVFDVAGVEVDRRQVYDQSQHARSITEFVAGLAEYWRETSADQNGKPTRYAPTEKDIEELVEFLRGDFDRIPSLSARADESSRQLLSLESDQYAVLDGLTPNFDSENWNPRFFIQGGAGTGKTLLAAEVARREAARNEGDVLLLCFNRVLQNVLEHNVQADNGGRIVVKTVGMLLNEIIAESSFAEEFREMARGVDDGTVYQELMPRFATDALLENGVQPFSAVIIDEAQDMMSIEMLDLLDPLIDGGFDHGRWWVFCDQNNQAAVFGVFEMAAVFRLMGSGMVSVLHANRRNTIQIATETELMTLPKHAPRASVEGIPVKVRFYKGDRDQTRMLSSHIDSLIQEGIEPHQISVLSPRNNRDCCASTLSSPGPVEVTRKNAWQVGGPSIGSITFSTVSSFKGLENDFIVLTDVEELSTEWWQGVVYVGMTRARTGLCVFMSESLEVAYTERQQMWLQSNLGSEQ